MSVVALEAEGVRDAHCFYNGFPDAPYGVGHLLLSHYADPEAARELIEGGHISVIGGRIGERRPDSREYLANLGGPNYPDPPADYQTIYYERD